jgi:predicted metal-dependent hydrolase
VAAIQDFVARHVAWARKTLVRVQQQKSERLIGDEDGDPITVWGERMTLRIRTGTTRDVTWQVEAGALVLTLPSGRQSPKHVRWALRKAFAMAVEQRAAELVPSFAERMGVRPGAITIGTARFRWGSCSSSGRLRFNARLAMLPPAMLEYVIVHELAHLREMNHSKRFWAIVTSILPDHRERRRYIRDHGHRAEI